MKNLQTTLTIASIAILTLFAHYIIYSQNQIQSLRQVITLLDTSKQIEVDNVRDLIYSNQLLNQKLENKNTASYVAGIIDATQRPDHHNEIWHDGYNRGTETQIMVQESENSQKLGLPKTIKGL